MESARPKRLTRILVVAIAPWWTGELQHLHRRHLACIVQRREVQLPVHTVALESRAQCVWFHPLIGLLPGLFLLVGPGSPASHRAILGLYIGFLPTDGRRLANARSYNNAVQNVPND
jgi:hypothetical protein